MKCPNCSKEVPDNAKVCGYCGTRLVKLAEELKTAKKKEAKPKAAQKQTVSEKKPEAIEKSKKKIAAAEAPSEKSQAKRTPLSAIIAVIVLLAVAAYLFFFTSVFRGEPTYIPWQCEREYAQTDAEIILYYTWTTLEKEQIAEYFRVADHSVSINYAPAKIKSKGFGKIEQDEQGFFKQMYWMKLGKFQPGQYRIHTFTNIREAVFDGWDWFGPGSEWPTFDNECLLIVEE